MGYAGDIDKTKHHTGIISFNLGDTSMRFRDGLPHGVFNKESANNYGSDTVAFCMIIALYQISYHLFLEHVSGEQTEEVRLLNSGWVTCNTEDFPPSLGEEWVYSSKTDSVKRLVANEIHHAYYGLAITESEKSTYRETPRVSDVLNRWLREDFSKLKISDQGGNQYRNRH